MTLWEAGDPLGERPAEPVESTWSVAELGRVITKSLRSAIPGQFWLRGEIRSLRAPNRTGHRFFDLVQPGAAPGEQPKAKISVTLFRDDRVRVESRLGNAFEELSDGIEIRILGRVDFWTGGGQLRVVMSDIDPSFTLGQLDAQRRALMAELSREGLLDRNAGLEIPDLPLRVGLVTSAGSAAHADFVHELTQSGYAFRIELVDARVQGTDATASVVRALARLAERGVDVIAVVRGGGSTTDLAAFDHGDIARAIALAPVPVFTGIGHEIDRSVADEVAHTSAKTPTAAAQAIVSHVAAVDAGLLRRRQLLEALGARRLSDARSRLAAVTTRVARSSRVATARAEASLGVVAQRATRASRVATRRAAGALDTDARRLHQAAIRRVARASVDLDQRVRRLATAPPRLLGVATERIESRSARVRTLDPQRTLARGWSITRTVDGRLVKDAGALASGDEITTTVLRGRIDSTVGASHADDPAMPPI